jgi:hypothetical protein
MPERAPKRVELARGDSERMRRLSEEVQGRLEEMAQITARVQGMKLDDQAVRKFVPRPERASDPSVITDVEIIDLPDGTNCCIISFDDGRPDICECPCGSEVF